MQNGIEFFTATCLKWQPLLHPDEHKDIIMNSLKFLEEDKRIWLYGYVIMLNHIHLMLEIGWANETQATINRVINANILGIIRSKILRTRIKKIDLPKVDVITNLLL